MADRCFVVGVAGASGAGKTYVASAVVDKLGQGTAVYLQHDSYYRDQSHLEPAARDLVNYDHPESLESELLAEHLRRLHAGEPVDVPVYDFSLHVRTPATVRLYPAPVVMLDGILVLAHEGLRAELDLAVYVDTDERLCVERRIARDVAERGRTRGSVLAQYAATVGPMRREFVEPSRRYADLVVAGSGDESIDEVLAAIPVP